MQRTVHLQASDVPSINAERGRTLSRRADLSGAISWWYGAVFDGNKRLILVC